MTGRRHRWWLAAAGVLLGALGCARQAPAPGAGGAPGPGAAGVAAEFTVLSYNIHHGEGTDGMLDLQRIADVINTSGAELVALQEVDERAGRTGGEDQAAELARLTGMHHAFAPFMDFQGGRYGLAVLSAHPIQARRVIQLPPGKHEPRAALLVEVAPPASPRLTLVSLHLDWLADDAERFAQAEALIAALEDEPAVILAGDFNDEPGSRTMRAFEEAGFVPAAPAAGSGATFPAGDPEKRIDFVMLRPGYAAKIVSEVLDEAVASDHRPVLARLWWMR